jgi:hypothetical protein
LKKLFDFNYTSREWVLIIILIFVTSKFIDFIAYTYSNNENVIGYVSIGSTLASIILAVLAIIYGFIQNHHQNVASISMVGQVDNLSNILTAIKLNNEKFNKDINRVEELRDTLDSSLEEIKNLKSNQDGLTSRFDSLLSELKNPPTTPFEEKNKGEILAESALFISDTRSLFDIPLLLLYLFEDTGVKTGDLSEKMLKFYNSKSITWNKVAGIVDATIIFLKKANLVTAVDEGFTGLDRNIKTYVLDNIINVELSSENIVSKVLTKLKTEYARGDKAVD